MLAASAEPTVKKASATPKEKGETQVLELPLSETAQSMGGAISAGQVNADGSISGQEVEETATAPFPVGAVVGPVVAVVVVLGVVAFLYCKKWYCFKVDSEK